MERSLDGKEKSVFCKRCTLSARKGAFHALVDKRTASGAVERRRRERASRRDTRMILPPPVHGRSSRTPPTARSTQKLPMIYCNSTAVTVLAISYKPNWAVIPQLVCFRCLQFGQFRAVLGLVGSRTCNRSCNARPKLTFILLPKLIASVLRVRDEPDSSHSEIASDNPCGC